MDCDQNEYRSQDGKCCKRCPAGKYVYRDCNSTNGTVCAECGKDLYTALENYLTSCIPCTQCYGDHHQTEVKACLAHEDRQCACIHGFYCQDPHSCEHCDQVTPCPLGQGVKVNATTTHDAVCAPCESGTFSNVSDSTSPCKTHTSCKDQGRVLERRGTHSADALCGPLESGCSWMLPAGLWSGLVLTSLLLILGLIYWRTKHKSRKTAFFSDPTDPVAPVSSGLPVVHLIPTELPVISPLIDVHCQESSDPRSHITAACNCCVRDLHATHPEPTSLLSVSQFEALPTLSQFEALPTLSQYEALPTSRRPGMLMDRMYSEPQEDEWGGT